MESRTDVGTLRSNRLRRVRPVVALAVVAFVLGAVVGSGGGQDARSALAGRFVAAWASGNYAAMYGDISKGSKRSLSAGELAAGCARALRAATATETRVVGKPREAGDGLIAVPVRVHTRLFGTLGLAFLVRVSDSGEEAGVMWSRSQEFPGLRPGEVLGRAMTLPRRATLLAREGSVLASGAATEAGQRASPLGAVASAVLGEVGPAPASRVAALEGEGVPEHAIVGVGGVEEALDSRLRGTPGGELLAHSERTGATVRVLARAQPRAATSVRTTVSPAVQSAAVSALGGQLGGVVAMRPDGEILAVAGLGIDDLQPPGSTFKMVTVSGVLAAKLASPRSSYQYGTYTTLDGVKLSNANGEECGGSLELAFAVSCNSVFAPLGVKLGAGRLVAMAEGYGFNHPPGIPGAVESTLPAASGIQGELELGATAIGQGQVQASALQMATVAATIADGGHRPQPTFAYGGAHTPTATATSAAVASTVRKLMVAVVREGTGTAAAIPGVTVAGKTGTAELGGPCSTRNGSGEEHSKGEASHEESGCHEASDTDAWFAAFAPALKPRVVVGVLMVKDGAGGATAAPVARQVIEAALHSR